MTICHKDQIMKKMRVITALLLLVTVLFATIVMPGMAESEVTDPTIRKIDFESQTVGGAMQKTTEWSYAKGYGEGAVSVKIGGDEENKYLSLIKEDSTQGGATVYPQDFKFDSYTFTGDINFATKPTGGSYYVYFVPNLGSPNNNAVVLQTTAAWTQVRGSGSEKNQNFMQIGSVYSFSYERTGTNVVFRLWEKKNPANSITVSQTVPDNSAQTQTPAIYLNGNSDGEVRLDNLALVNRTSDRTAIRTVAHQQSVGTETNAVRFIATLDSLEYEKVGYVILAKPETGTTRSFEGTTTKVYTSVLAVEEQGLTAYAASELGGAYLMAIGIKDCPTDLGTIIFTVTPFYETAWGTRIYCESSTVTVPQSE